MAGTGGRVDLRSCRSTTWPWWDSARRRRLGCYHPGAGIGIGRGELPCKLGELLLTVPCCWAGDDSRGLGTDGGAPVRPAAVVRYAGPQRRAVRRERGA